MLKLILISIVIIIKCDGLIVPQELPSLLSLVYSTIPQIKKGTDSRFGFGFRLGEHADVQLMVELGPQTETRPIGDSESSNSFTSKRQINPKDYDKIPKKKTNSKDDGNAWLKNWSNDMIKNIEKTSNINNSKKNQYKNTNLNPAVQTTPLISEKALQELQVLYKLSENLNNSKNITKT